MIRHAIIQAGGQGTRLRPVTLEIPKPLVPVQGVPIATWLVRLFAVHGVERVTVVYPTNWKIHFEAWAAWPHQTSVELFEETQSMGTMGALVHELVLGQEPIFVTNGDELKSLNVSQLAEFHMARQRDQPPATATIALVRVQNPSDYGVAEMNGDRIARFHEKPAIPPSTLVNSGLYVINPAAFDCVDRSKQFLMFEQDFFPRLAQEGRLAGCQLDGQWYDCGTMERWERAITEWKGI